VVLAKEIVVLCGTSVLEWECLYWASEVLGISGASDWLQGSEMKLNKKVKSSPIGKVPQCLAVLRRACSSGIPLDDFGEYITAADVAQAPTRVRMIFCTCLDFFIRFSRLFKSSKPEDKLYAPLAIVTHLFSEISPSQFLVPKYENTVTQIYTEVTESIICETQLLSLLSAVEEVSVRQFRDLPTWVPDFSVSSILPLVSFYEPFCAIGGCHSPHRLHVSDRKLYASGFILDSISCLGPSMQDNFIGEDCTAWIEFLLDMDRVYVNGESRSDVFMRTLVAGQEVDDDVTGLKRRFRTYLMMIYGRNYMSPHARRILRQHPEIHDSEFQEALQEAASRRGNSSPWPILEKATSEGVSDIIPTWFDISTFILEMLKDGFEESAFIERRWQLVKNILNAGSYRRLFISSKKYVGLIPFSAQIGDVISFIPGSEIPFLLRRTQNGYYLFVGETYVHGLMYGELFQDLSIEPDAIVLK
jgi:hypothetical protein